MPRYALLIAYDGRELLVGGGNGRRSVAGEFDSALSRLGEQREVLASRTDTGVHAMGQVAHVDQCAWDPAQLRTALDSQLLRTVAAAAWQK